MSVETRYKIETFRKGCRYMDKFEMSKVMEENADTPRTVAEFLGISLTSFYNKRNEYGTEFTKSEISKMAAKWKLSPERLNKIFFA